MSRRSFFWLRFVGLAVIGVLATAVIAVGWLTGTTSGARFALNQAIARAPGTLSVSNIEGALLRGLSLTGIRYDIAGTEVEIESLAIDIAPGILFDFRQLTVERLHMDGVRLTTPPPAQPVPASNDSDFVVPALPRLSLPLSLTLQDVAIREFAWRERGADAPILQVAALTLDGGWRGTEIAINDLQLESSVAAVSLRGDVNADGDWPLTLDGEWRLPTQQPLAGRVSLRGDRARLDVRHKLAEPLVAVTEGRVMAPTDAPVTVDLRTRIENAEIAVVERTLRIVNARIDTRGRPRAWSVDVDGEFTEALLGTASLGLRAAGDLTAADIAEATLARADGGSARVNGTLLYGDGLGIDADVVTEALPLDGFIDAITGSVDADLRVSLRQAQQWGGRVEFRRVTGVINDTDFSASGSLVGDPSRVTIDALEVAVGSNRLRASGTVARGAPWDLEGTIDAPTLAQVYPPLQGGLSADLKFAGDADAPRIEANLRRADVVFRDFAVTGARGDISLTRDSGDVRLEVARFAFGTQTAEDIVVRADGGLAAHTVAVTATALGRYATTVEARGGYADAEWRGTLTTLAATFDWPFGQQRPLQLSLREPVDLLAGARAARLAPMCIDSDRGGSVCAEASLADRTLALELDADGIELAEYLPPATTVRWSGTLTASAAISGPLAALTGDASIAAAGLTARHVVEERDAVDATDPLQQVTFDQAEVTASLRAGALSARALATVPDAFILDANFNAARPLAADGPVSGALRVETEALQTLNPLIDVLQLQGGALSLSASLDGTREAPIVQTDLVADRIAARVAPLGIVLEDTQLRASSDDPRALAFSASGRSGGGSFAMQGDLALTESGPLVTADVTAEAFQFINLPDLSGDASMDVDLKLTPLAYTVAGALTIDKADIVVRDLPESAVAVSGDAAVYGSDGQLLEDADEDRAAVTLDLDLSLSEQVALSGFGLATRLTGDLDLRQRPETDLRGVGVLQLEDATYKAYGQTLNVTRGRLVFNGPLDQPQLDFRAQREIDDILVGINVTGTPDRLSSELFSTPPLRDAEAFSLLLTGRNLGAANQEEGAALADAAVTLGLRQAFGVSGSIRDAVGLDTLTVTGSGRGGRLLAGKSLTPNLYLQYAYGVFDQVSSVLLRLKLSKRLSLESTSGETQSVDLIYSVGRGGGP